MDDLITATECNGLVHDEVQNAISMVFAVQAIFLLFFGILALMFSNICLSDRIRTIETLLKVV